MTTDERLARIMSNHREPDLRNCEACWLAAELSRAREELRGLVSLASAAMNHGLTLAAGGIWTSAKRGLGEP